MENYWSFLKRALKGTYVSVVSRMIEHKDKAEGKGPKIKKSPEYRRFERLLKRVVNAPPMRKIKDHGIT
jgi:hypothetical protein